MSEVQGPDTAMREKYWEERSLDEKLEKLAETTECLAYRFSELLEVYARLKIHSHSQNGEIVVPLRSDSEFYRPTYFDRNPLRRESKSK